MSPKPHTQKAAQALVRLMELVERLRAPDGCPWDRRQNPRSVAPYILEEAYEAVEAVEQGQAREVCAELGDLVFQVAFMAQLFAEQELFDLSRVLESVTEKMIRRHPHVFAREKAASAEEVKGLWGRIKSRERRQNHQGLLDSLPRAAPALVRAHRLGQRVARVGFDWTGADQVWDKVQEELEELRGADSPRQQERELGDLLFTLAQWARHQGLGAESALRRANARFQRRFQAMENLARSRGLELERMDPAEMDRLWEEIKSRQANEPPTPSLTDSSYQKKNTRAGFPEKGGGSYRDNMIPGNSTANDQAPEKTPPRKQG